MNGASRWLEACAVFNAAPVKVATAASASGASRGERREFVFMGRPLGVEGAAVEQESPPGMNPRARRLTPSRNVSRGVWSSFTQRTGKRMQPSRSAEEEDSPANRRALA